MLPKGLKAICDTSGCIGCIGCICYTLLQQSFESRCKHWHRRLLCRRAPVAVTGTLGASSKLLIFFGEKNGGLGLMVKEGAVH